MVLLSKESLKGISFNTLKFVEPFSEIHTGVNQYSGKPVLLNGVGEKPGVLVVKYVDCAGITRHYFKSIEHCLGNAARRVLSLVNQKGARDVNFAVIPTDKRYHRSIIQNLKKDYFRCPLDNHFEIVEPWLTGKRTDVFPIDLLEFRRPFFNLNNSKRFSFHDYVNRDGLYVIREKLVPENQIINAYVGKSLKVLPCRIKDKFYPNPHLYYREIPGEVEYYISIIEIQRNKIPKRLSFEKTLKKYEDVLMNILDTRDNKLGMLRTEDVSIIEGWRPMEINGVPIKENPF